MADESNVGAHTCDTCSFYDKDKFSPVAEGLPSMGKCRRPGGRK